MVFERNLGGREMNDVEHFVVLPNGKKAGPYAARKIRDAYEAGKIPDGSTVAKNGTAVAISEWVGSSKVVPPDVPAVLSSGEQKPSRNDSRVVILIALVFFVAVVAMWATLQNGSDVADLRATIERLQKSNQDLEKQIAVVRSTVSANSLDVSRQIFAANEHNETQRVAVEDGLEYRIAAMGTTMQRVRSDFSVIDDAVKEIRNRLLALERRFGLAPDPNPHPKEAFKESGLPGPKLETEKSSKKDETD
jgi:hypothetical protein